MRKITLCLVSAALFFAGSLACHAVPIADLSEISDLGGSYELTARRGLTRRFHADRLCRRAVYRNL